MNGSCSLGINETTPDYQRHQFFLWIWNSGGFSIIMNKGHIGGGKLASCRSLLIYIYILLLRFGEILMYCHILRVHAIPTLESTNSMIESTDSMIESTDSMIESTDSRIESTDSTIESTDSVYVW